MAPFEEAAMKISAPGDLRSIFARISRYRPRFGVADITDFVMGNDEPVVCGIIGLRRTGKTTMMWQAMAGLPEPLRNGSLYLEMEEDDDMDDLTLALEKHHAEGRTIFFVDEITNLYDFAGKGAALANTYAARGLKIVLSGTDSLLIEIARRGALFDRVVPVRTTWMPWREYVSVTGRKEIHSFDNYLEGGGILYNDMREKIGIEAYIRTAIIDNLVNSLDNDHDGENYGGLAELRHRNALKDFILRVLNDNTHRFFADFFKKHKIAEFETAKGIVNRKFSVSKQHIQSILGAIKSRLGHIDWPSKESYPGHDEIETVCNWLKMMDVFVPESVRPGRGSGTFLLTQPALRWHQVLNVVDEMLRDEAFRSILGQDSEALHNSLTSALKGEILEDIVLVDVQRTLCDHDVSSWKFTVDWFSRQGEIDMVVTRRNRCRIPRGCDIYEIKKNRNPSWEQAMHLRWREYVEYLGKSQGSVRHRIVLYRGREFMDFDDVMYLSVEDFLLELPRYEEMLAEKCEILEMARDAHDRHVAAWITENLGMDGLREQINAYRDRSRYEREIPFADWLRMKGTMIPMPWETGDGAEETMLPGGWKSWTRLQEAVFAEREGVPLPEETSVDDRSGILSPK